MTVHPIRDADVPTSVHVGDVLRPRLGELGMSVSELADRTALSRTHINQILSGKGALTPETALKIERATQTSAELLLNIDAAHRLEVVRATPPKDAKERKRWAKAFPTGWLDELDLLPEGWRDDPASALLTFFGVADLKAYEAVAPAVMPRFSHHENRDAVAVRTWLRAGQVRAPAPAKPYDRDGLLDVIPSLPTLTSIPDAADAFRAMQQRCRDVGVAVSAIPEPPGAKINGATLWASAHRPIVIVSGRHKRADILWFTLMHELAHVLLHTKSEPHIAVAPPTDDLRGVPVSPDPAEAEADAFAARSLIPPALDKRLATMPPTKKAVLALADELDIHPEILIGRLQHLERLPYHYKWAQALHRRIEPKSLL